METREEQQLNLIPVSVVNNCEYGAESSSSFPSIPHSSSKENLLYLVQKQRYDSRLKLIGDSPIKSHRSWASKKFMTGCVILLPIAITFYTTWWFIHFVDGFFSPIYKHLGISIFGLGFVTSITFIFIVGVFMSSWLGASVLSLGEWLIKKMPLISYIYSASKQNKYTRVLKGGV
ncbi:hypothetical protein J1N35_038513 [Gossypium stocksii]|uniref:Uncharacterized protein n=1 Tax=Gossypium stocksii TaxID=47602 RepID=A0A9D3UNZ9_9ROSI|nr:hypothetical protein J1N35_038513 [Gossypium stocksii]